MQEPLSIPRFIALVTDKPQEKEVVSAWFACVKQSAPSGTLLNIPTSDDTGMPKTVCLVHREQGNQHRYLVPLSRDLSESEGEAIVDAFTDRNPELDFDVQSSATHGDETKSQPPVIVDQAHYVNLCTAWAKRQHESWMKDREENGWRYGTMFSLKDKVNPLMRPWDQLPEKYRKIDLDEPQALLDLLNDQGYAVVTKGELEAMLNLMRVSNPLLRESAEPKGSANLAKAIGNAMNAVKQSQGIQRDDLRKAVSYFNVARTLWKLGDLPGVQQSLAKGIAVLDAAEKNVDEGLFGIGKKPAPSAVPDRRLRHATLDRDGRAAANDWDPEFGGRPTIRSPLKPYEAPPEPNAAPHRPAAPADALPPPTRVFGRRNA